VELSLGLFVLIVPAVLHASTAGVVLGIVLGAVLMGLAFSGSGVMDGHPERPPLGLHTHRLADAGAVVALLGAALVTVFAGDLVSAATFTLAAAAGKGLELWTHYGVTE
jgi:hypothetical protein